MKYLLWYFLLMGDAVHGQVEFHTTDRALQSLYDKAERKCLANIQYFGKYQVLVEGAGYSNVWLETQPMGGEMYAKRNMLVALNNQLIFMESQRADGRMPGMISVENDRLVPHYGWLQGFCFPEPALQMYYRLNGDTAYLHRLYVCLERFDSYLWKTRDSDGDGCLESWCVWDTGDDNSVLYEGAPNEWPKEYAPPRSSVPMASMDVMSYSYSCREVLAKISTILNNGKASYWQKKSQAIKDKVKSYLWDTKKQACFDRNPDHQPINILLNNNIRCMYYGSFDQQMADSFIARHLFNPREFWTPMPLPSIAANDHAFQNIPGNNWSGQSEGLTFQRAISALENYGHYAEVPLIGNRLIEVLEKNNAFTQQYDPFTGKAGNGVDGYGPTLLSMLEYISRMYGIQYENGRLFWSGLSVGKDTTRYIQYINNQKYMLIVNSTVMTAYLNDKLLFSSSPNVRYVTSLQGELLAVIGLDSRERNITVQGNSFKVKSNGVYNIRGKKIKADTHVPFMGNKN